MGELIYKVKKLDNSYYAYTIGDSISKQSAVGKSEKEAINNLENIVIAYIKKNPNKEKDLFQYRTLFISRKRYQPSWVK